MNEFVEKFSKMIDYGFLGIYRRQKLSDEAVETRFVPALTKACGIGAFLNLKYNLTKDGNRILPETEFELFKMFQYPLSELIDILPDKYRCAVIEMTNYYGVETLFEESEKGKGIITEDGVFLNNGKGFDFSKLEN